MMKTIEGVVVKLGERNVNTRNGPATSYSALVNTGSGEEWFGFGWKKPTITPSQVIKFVAKGRTYTNRDGLDVEAWDADTDTLEVSKAPAARQSTTVKQAVKSANHKDRMIVQQTAYKVATDAVAGAVASGALALPKTKAKAWEAFQGYIHEFAAELSARFIDPPEEFNVHEDAAANMSEDEDEYNPV